jgi:YD repeat-containing protein
MKHIFTLMGLLLVGATYGQQLISEKRENWINGTWEQFYQITEYEYDQQEQLARETIQLRHATGVLLNNGRTSYSYRTDGQMDQFTNAQWNNAVQLWVTGRTTTYTYENENQTGFMLINADGTPFRKEEKLYDAEGNVSEKVAYAWDIAANDWIGLRKNNYIYDGNGLLIEGTFSYGNAEGWLLVSRQEYMYDGAGRLIVEERDDWSNEQWINAEQTLYTYNNEGLLEVSAFSLWDEDMGDFIRDSQTEITYTDNDLEETITISVWDEDEFTYRGNQQTRILYNSDQTVSERIYKYWEITTETWQNISRVRYTYGTSYLALNEQQERTAIGIYPNPAQDVLHVNLGTIEPIQLTVFDQQGQMFWSETAGAEQQSIPVAQWPAGAYVLKIGSGEQQQVRKFVKN